MTGMPVFIKVERYKEVLEIMEVLRTKISQAKKTLAKINELKDKEDQELAAWSNAVNDVEKRVEGIDSGLFEPEQM